MLSFSQITNLLGGDFILPSQPQAYPLYSGGLPYLYGMVPLNPNESEIELSLNWWNAFRYDFQQLSGNATLVDAEGLFFSLQIRQDLGASWSLGWRAEVQSVFAGVLDPLIEGFHSLFGLPNQGRENRPQNILLVYHAQNSSLVVNSGNSYLEPSLLYFWLQHNFPVWEGLRLGVQAGFKPALPWGRLNSKAVGFNLGMLYHQTLNGSGLWWGSQLGLGYQTTPYLPPEESWNWILQWGAYLGWQVSPNLILLARLDLQSSPYWGEASVSSGRQGNSLFGSAWKLANSTWLVAALQEEGLTWATVEVGFLIFLVYRPSPWVYDEL